MFKNAANNFRLRTSFQEPKSKIQNILLSTFLLFILTQCQVTPPIIKIGLVAPFEGKQRAIGYDVIYSARLAVREINEAGGINGVHVTLIALDDTGDPTLAQQAAASLIVDPNIVIVVGHWLESSTNVALPLYQNAGIPLIHMGPPPFGTVEPATLPDNFRQNYADLTPFDETASIYAGTTYDAMQLIFVALATIEGDVTREKLTKALYGLEITGITGTIYLP